MYIENEEENYTIFTTLWKNVAIPVVREVFVKRNQALPLDSRWKYVPGTASNFGDVLCNSKGGSNIFKNMPIDQKNKLRNENISDWDLSLLHILLINIDYSNGSEKIEADHAKENNWIQKLKDTRNEYSHFSPGRIPQKKFIKLWSKAEEALKSLHVPPETIKAVKESGIIRSFQIFEPPSVNLVKRPELLQDLHTQFCACSAMDSLEERTVVLWGFDEIGKTELARMYAEAYLEDSIIQQNVAWIKAEDFPTLEASFLHLAKVLKLSHTQGKECLEIVEIAQNIYKHFSKHIPAGVFIFDNLYSLDQSFEISDYLPKPSPELNRYPLILITTRDCDKLDLNYKFIKIKTFIKSELYKYLSTKFEIDIVNDLTSEGKFNHKKLALERLTEELDEYPPEIILPKIELYLQRLCKYKENKNPKNSFITKDGDGDTMGFKYELVFANTWDVRVEKFRDLGDTASDAVEILNFVAYLPTDEIKKGELEKLLKPSGSVDTASIQKSLDFLAEHSLIGLHYSGEIKVDLRLQMVVRDRLNRENNSSYLLYVCNYVSSRGLETVSGGVPRMLLTGAPSHFVVHRSSGSGSGSGDGRKVLNIGTIMCIHEYLKILEWSNNTIVYSVIFSSLLVDMDEGWIIAKDVFEFCTETERGSRTFWNAVKLSPEENAVKLLFLLSLFCISEEPMNESEISGHRMWKEPHLSKGNLDMNFLSLAKPSIEHKMVPKTNLTIAQKHCYKLGFTSLQKLYRVMIQNLTPNVEDAVVQEISETVLSVINSIVGCSRDSIHEIYELLWNCFSCREHSNYIQYMEAAFQKHFEIFPTLNFHNESLNENEARRYWSCEIPIHFRSITYRCNSAHTRHVSDLITEAFFAKGGLQIIIQYLQFLGRPGVIIKSGDDLKLLYFIVSLPRTCNLIWTEKFVHTMEFMEAYCKFTTKLTDLKYNNKDFVLEKITCSMIWFMLFFEYFGHVPAESSEFTVNSVVAQLTMLCDQLSEIKWSDDCKLWARQLKPLLEVFMQEWKYDCITQVAVEFDILLMMQGIQFKNTRDKSDSSPLEND